MKMDYSDHRRQLHQNRFVYAVVSRRAGGLSIGINLNPDKVCNFDCPYCQVDRTVPGYDGGVDLLALERELMQLLQWVSDDVLWNIPPFNSAAPIHRRVVDISLAGDGEPTSSKSFADVIQVIGRLRAAFGLDNVKVQCLTNATLFQKDRVRIGLQSLWGMGGEVWAKLDAGTEEWFHLIDGTRYPFERMLENIKWAALQYPIVLQCMFHRWDGSGPSRSEQEEWANRIKEIYESGGKIRHIQVYTVARKPSDNRVQYLEEAALIAIANRARAVVEKYGQSTSVMHYPGLPV
jgi:wyosine [tRNA(Phe)-imidazoG37] synthetase (radical SAM superfamily)